MIEERESNNGNDVFLQIHAILKIITLILFLIGFAIVTIWMDYENTAQNTVIYRVSQDKFMFDFTTWDWLRARGNHPDYQQIIFDQDPDIAGAVDNVAYRAQLKFVGDEELVRGYLEQDDDPETELSWAVRSCVPVVTRWSTSVKYHPDVNARAISVSDMNNHCPLTQYGYEWDGPLEIVQCYPYPDDQAMRNLCLQTARSIPPYE